MAKKISEKKPVVKPKPEVKSTIDENFEVFGKNINPKGTKYVVVKAFKDHKCEINKVPYDLKTGGKYNVSEFASMVLERGGIV